MDMKSYISLLFSVTLLLAQCQASPRPWPKLSWVKQLGHHRSKNGQKREAVVVSEEDTYIPITALYENSFLPLSDIEAANITEFLHNDEGLNLTWASNATR